MADQHRPITYFDRTGGGVACTCGQDYAIGSSYPDTPGGKPSKKRVKNMRQAWDLYRAHWRPGEADSRHHTEATDVLRKAGLIT